MNQQFRIAATQPILLPCKICGSPAVLWQENTVDDVWHSFGACSNDDDVDGEPCIFHMPDAGMFYRERICEAAEYWNKVMGPRDSQVHIVYASRVVSLPIPTPGISYTITNNTSKDLKIVASSAYKVITKVKHDGIEIIEFHPGTSEATGDR